MPRSLPVSERGRDRLVWPDETATPVVRAREMASAYRLALAELMPEAVAELDAQFWEWGEVWHAPAPPDTFDEDDWVPLWAACGLLGVRDHTLGNYRSTGRIKGRWRRAGANGGFLFRIGDLLDLQQELATAQGRIKGRLFVRRNPDGTYRKIELPKPTHDDAERRTVVIERTPQRRLRRPRSPEVAHPPGSAVTSTHAGTERRTVSGKGKRK
jgi:hypothetical protein